MDYLGQAHPDIELGAERSPLAYLTCLPDGGVTTATGLILYLGGYGMDARGGYAQSLLPYLANRHNCVAATVEYFGSAMLPGEIVPHPRFFQGLARHYGLQVGVPRGMPMDEVLAKVTEALARHGVTELPHDCTLYRRSREYNSMGFLPALDGLTLVHHLLMSFGLDRSRLFLLGTSYGGYIASLMAKLAPRTFRMVVDNSGFSSAEDDRIGVLGGQTLRLNGIAAQCQSVWHWTFDESAPNYFSEARRAIRDLRHPAHVLDNTARTYGYHAVADTIAPTERKIQLRDAYRGRVPYELELVDGNRIDGRLFKTQGHGMNASMRGLFDLSHEKFLRDGGALADDTDFDRRSTYAFPCGREDYVLSYSPETGVAAALRAA
jgi:pimeloyl-ACP methyl ester carboxylesterase